MQKLGEYFIIDKLTTSRPNCQRYIISLQEHPKADQQFTAVLQLLTPRDLQNIQKGKLLSLLPPGDSFIEEVLFVHNRITDRKYIACIRNPNRRTTRLSDSNISAKESIKIIIEFLLLIQTLHKIGLKLQEPLRSFLQMEDVGRIEGLPCVSMMKINVLVVNHETKNAFDNQPPTLQEELQFLSKGELRYLKLFLNQIAKILEINNKIIPRNLSKVWRIVDRAVKRDLAISAQQLINAFLSFTIEDEKFVVRCLFEPWNKTVWAQFIEKQTQRSVCYCEKEVLEVNKQDYYLTEDFLDLLSINEVSCTILSHGEIQIEYNYNQSNLLVCFKNRQTAKFQQRQKMDYGQYLGQFEGDQFMQEGKEAQQQQAVSQNQGYPSICVLRIVSTFIVEGKKRKKQGVGSLIGRDLVITCAHLVYSYFATYTQQNSTKKVNKIERYQATKVEVFVKGQWIDTHYQFPQQFKIPKKSRENDFALLYLKKSAGIKQYLSLARNWRTSQQISLIKLQKCKNLTLMKMISTKKSQKIENKKILPHNFTTKQGDSGSPIIVFYQAMNYTYAIVAIHTGSQAIGKQSLKFTQAIVKELARFQKELTNRNISEIELKSIEYEQVMNKAAERLQEIKKKNENLSCEEKAKAQYHRYMVEQARKEEFIFKGNEVLTRKDVNERMWKIRDSYSKFAGKYISKFGYATVSGQMERQKQKLVKQIDQLRQKYLKSYRFDPVFELYLTTLQIYQNHIQTGRLETTPSQQADYFKFFETMVSINQDLFKQQAIPWQRLFLHKKYEFFYTQYFQNYYYQHFFLNKQIDFTRTFTSFRNTYTDINVKPFDHGWGQLFSYQFHSSQNFKLNPSIPQQTFSAPFLAPYHSYRCNGSYQLLNNQVLYQLQYEVGMDSQTEVNQYCMQHLRFASDRLPFVYPTRLIDDRRKSYGLKVKLRTISFASLQDFILIVKDKLPFMIVPIFAMSIDFMAKLHSSGLYLCSPLQFCLLFDFKQQSNSFACIFIYFGHPKALNRKVKLLLQSSLKEQQKKRIYDYYPVEEILRTPEEQDKYVKIDIWLMGKSLSRCIDSFPSTTSADPLVKHLKEDLSSLIVKMTRPPKERIGIQEAQNKIEETIKRNPIFQFWES